MAGRLSGANSSAFDTASPDKQSTERLKQLAVEGRRLVLSTAHHAGAGHVGGALSAIDLLIALYFDCLKIDPMRPDWPDRDRFILSKGHCALALYVVMAMRGYLPIEELQTFDRGGSRLQMHPDMQLLPGLDLSTGSLGQGLAAGVGMALGLRLQHCASRVWVMAGDGELQEGMMWEAIHAAARHRLGGLTLIVDQNGLQQYGWPAEIGCQSDRSAPWARTDLAAVFAGFGWRVLETNGNDMSAVQSSLEGCMADSEKPTVLLARTTKGKGVSFMEGSIKWHTGAPNADELRRAFTELAQEGGQSC